MPEEAPRAEQDVVPVEAVRGEADGQPQAQQQHDLSGRPPALGPQARDGESQEEHDVEHDVGDSGQPLGRLARVGERRGHEDVPGHQPRAQRHHRRIEPEGGPLVHVRGPAAQPQDPGKGQGIARQVQEVGRRGSDQPPVVGDLQQEVREVAQPEDGERPGEPEPGPAQLGRQAPVTRGAPGEPEGGRPGDEHPGVAHDVRERVGKGDGQLPAGQNDGEDPDQEEEEGIPRARHLSQCCHTSGHVSPRKGRVAVTPPCSR